MKTDRREELERASQPRVTCATLHDLQRKSEALRSSEQSWWTQDQYRLRDTLRAPMAAWISAGLAGPDSPHHVANLVTYVRPTSLSGEEMSLSGVEMSQGQRMYQMYRRTVEYLRSTFR